MNKQAYIVLARKYRPQIITDLVGQDVLIQAISNAIKLRRIAHAFLLTGIRGVGKTTTARIIAKSLNCMGADGKGKETITPCGTCSACVAITEGSYPDVVEIDAASKTGVNDIRELIEDCNYLPLSARYKIYIIDEVHMLSNSAFNALLKTLEEPPAHVKFVFATTELRKIPVTIISRCQKFTLKMVGDAILMPYLQKISKQEGFKLDDKACKLISNASGGSVRDALSMLDRAFITSIDDKNESIVTVEYVMQMLGINGKEALLKLLAELIATDIKASLAILTDLYNDGNNEHDIIAGLMEVIYEISAVKLGVDLSENIINDADMEKIKQFAGELSHAALARIWQMLVKGITELKDAGNAFIALKMIFIRISYIGTLPEVSQLLDMVENNMGDSGNNTVESEEIKPLITKDNPDLVKHILDNFQDSKVVG